MPAEPRELLPIPGDQQKSNRRRLAPCYGATLQKAEGEADAHPHQGPWAGSAQDGSPGVVQALHHLAKRAFAQVPHDLI